MDPLAIGRDSTGRSSEQALDEGCDTVLEASEHDLAGSPQPGAWSAVTRTTTPTATRTATRTAAAPSVERALVAGTRWVALSTLVVGGLNYAYSLVLTRVLSTAGYADFAAGQSLLLTAGTVAVASIPWVLARELGRPGLTVAQRRRVVSFAAIANLAQGVVAGLLVFALSTSFASAQLSAILGVAALVIFAGSTVGGWLQGERRFGLLAAMRVVEVVVKVVAGLALTRVGAGVPGPAGALAGFGIGAIVVCAAGAWLMRGDVRRRGWFALAPGLWPSVVGVASVQGLVAVLASLDVVLVAVLPAPPSSAASYQASMILARVPLFLGGAVAVVAFPLLAKATTGTGIVRMSIRLYVAIAAPFAIALATMPPSLLGRVFPPEYTQVAEVLRWTAGAGFMIGLIELLTTYYQAEGLYRPCIRRQLAGLAVSAVAIPLGWSLGGIQGLAIGALLGSSLSAWLLLLDCGRRWGGSVVLRTGPFLGAAVLVGCLLAARGYPVIWAVLAGALILRRAHRVFIRAPELPAPEIVDGASSAPLHILHLGFEDHRRPGSGGGSMRNREVNSRLAERHHITVLTTNYPGARDRIEDGVRYVPIGLAHGYLPSVLSYLMLVPFHARRYRADLVVEDFAPPFTSVLMPWWSGRPTVALVQWLNAREKAAEYHLPLAVFERLGARAYSRMTTVSQDMRARLEALNPRARVDVVPNGVDRAAFGVHETKSEDIAFLGRLEVAQKGLDLLLAAYAVAAPGLGGRLLLGGDGPDRGRLERQAAELGIADRVRFVERITSTDRYRFLLRARLVVMPSRFETFGMVAIEALASGTPVLAFDILGLREVVPADCGVLVPAFDIAAYAAQLQRLYSDHEMAARMASAGRDFARDFDWDLIAVQQEQVYLRAVAAGKEGGWRLGHRYAARHHLDPAQPPSQLVSVSWLVLGGY